MIVCVCRRVTDHQIRQAVAEGARTLECLQLDLGVAMQCGRCADCASRLLCEAPGVSPQPASNAPVFPITIVRTAARQRA